MARVFTTQQLADFLYDRIIVNCPRCLDNRCLKSPVRWWRKSLPKKPISYTSWSRSRTEARSTTEAEEKVKRQK